MNEILINVVHNIIEDDVPYADLLIVWEVIDIAIQVLQDLLMMLLELRYML